MRLPLLVLLLALGALMLLVYRRSRVEAQDIEPAISRARSRTVGYAV